MTDKTAEAADVSPNGDLVIRITAMPADTNPAGDIFGGWLMWNMDLAASSVANSRARSRCVTAAVEGMSFLQKVRVGDEVSFYAQCLSVGRTSMKISVEAWRRRREGVEMYQVTHATFICVAMDEAGNPRLVDAPQAVTASN